jgi:hypothetical protein
MVCLKKLFSLKIVLNKRIFKEQFQFPKRTKILFLNSKVCPLSNKNFQLQQVDKDEHRRNCKQPHRQKIKTSIP